MSDLNITIEGGTSKRLLVKGTMPRKNIVVTATGGDPILQEKTITENGVYTADSGYDGLSKVTVNVPTGGGGGDCSGTHVIEVGELPTENIDTNAVYLCKGAYYKYAQVTGFTDVIGVENGVPQSVAEVYPSYGIPVYFYTIPTKTTDAIESADTFHCYYIEDENDVLLYMYGEWVRFNSNWTFGGIITDTSEATDSNTYYALMGSVAGWTKYLAPIGTLEITESGTYDVSEYASAEVNATGEVVEEYDGTISVTGEAAEKWDGTIIIE